MFVAVKIQAQTVDSLRVYELQGVEVIGEERPSVVRSTAPLQIIDKKSIDRLGLQGMSDVVRRFSGVTVKDYGGIGGLKTVSVRSLGAQHTAVSYDGVTISDCQSGQVDISRFSLDNVSMLSLTIGQADDIFQTARLFASAGVLRIKTLKPVFTDKNFETQLRLRGGSFGFINPSLRYSQKLNKHFAISADVDWLRADGQYPFTLKNGTIVTQEKRRNTDIQSLRTELNLYATVGKNGGLDAKFYYFDSERGLPGSIVLYNDYNNERLWDKNFFAQLRYENKFNSLFSLQIQGKYNRTYTKYLDINNKYETGSQEDRHTQQEYYGSGALLYTPLEGLSFSLATDFALNTLKSNFMDSPLPERYTSLTVLAGQYRNRFMTVTASLLETYIMEKVKTGDKPADRQRLSPSIGLSFRPWASQNLYFRLMYKDIFRVPTFNDMYYLRIGNRNLKPEAATQYNFGITWSGVPFTVAEYLTISADAYYNRVRDKIVALPTMFIWKMLNLGEVEIKGLDVNLATVLPLHDRVTLQLAANYSYQKAVDITNATQKTYRHQIPYTPEHSGSGSLSVEMPWVNVAYTLLGSGERYAFPQNTESNKIDSYLEQSISLNRSFRFERCTLRLQGEIVNLANKQYDVIKYYPMPGRSWRLSCQITL